MRIIRATPKFLNDRYILCGFAKSPFYGDITEIVRNKKTGVRYAFRHDSVYGTYSIPVARRAMGRMYRTIANDEAELLAYLMENNIECT